MKKALLLLIFLLSFTVNAQMPTIPPPPPMFACDDNNDGFASFDLSSRIPNLIGQMNPATTTLSFHETPEDFQANANPITNITNYINIIPFSQRLFVRVVDETNGNILYGELDLQTIPIPVANPTSMSYCDPMELAIYSLHQADHQITGGSVSATVTYHLTFADAEAGANPLEDMFIPTVSPGVQILYARVFGGWCFNITTLTLNTQNCGDGCSAPTNLSATNVTDTTFTFNWQSNPNSLGTIFTKVVLLPYGSPPPNANTPGTYDVPADQQNITFTGLTPNFCYTVYAKKYCDVTASSQWSQALNVCLADCANSGQCSEILVLTAFFDENNNGVKDSGESNFNNGNFVYQINDSGTNLFGASNNGAYFIFDSNPTNSYDLSFAINSNLSTYYASSVTHNNITLPSGSGANYLYFPVVNIQPHLDADVSLYPSGQPRPGFGYSNTISYTNNGFQAIPNGTITFAKHPSLGITTISEGSATQTSGGFTYSFTNLAPFETRHITVGLQVPTIPTVNLGDLVTNSVTIEINNDINPTNNTSSITQAIVGSYDPNDKTELHGRKIVHSSFTSNDYLYYTIQFENTGTANAEFIRIEDELNVQLDENTFEMLNASHTVNTKREGNQLVWHFYSIDLPPTISDPIGSHGFVHFRIKPKSGYAIGDIIPNTASIYFDYNPPIVTDTFYTEFVQSMGNAAFDTDAVSLSPNPASNWVTITNDTSVDKIASLAIYDISGKRIYSLTKASLDTISIDVSSFSRGMYLVEILSESNIKVVKKLLLK
ncbi:T9SS type A sorting domain-containing protein [Flavobacterium sp.]